MQTYDVIWIGTGQATGTIVPRLAKAGKRVAIVEAGRVGGTCVNFGCTPTKTIVASARAAHMARRGADFGVVIPELSIDFAKVMARQNSIRNQNSASLEQWLTNLEGVDFYKAQARFESDHTVRVGEEIIAGATMVIHTGARARNPAIPGLDEVPWLDNVRLLDLPELPPHLVILGGSYISLEFAQAFRRFGSEVTLIERGAQLMFREDEDIAAIALDLMKQAGIKVHLNAAVERVAQTMDGGVEIFLVEDNMAKLVQGSHLLVAAGRVPNTDTLNLPAAGVVTNERGYIQVNEVLQSNVAHIYALGDVNGAGAFTHTSVHDGQIFWDHYSGEGDRKLSDRNPIYAMYIDPPLGRVGIDERTARQSGRNVLMATKPLSKISRAIEKDETDGLIKIFVDGDSEEILGATVFGTGGDEIISLFAAFMMTKQSYKVFQRAVLPHPTVAEYMPFILEELKPLG
jgi:pyruvate/2-oxoglutarate dehydrogenase complex dihydrolipoamide dehydrogenase (E3) component